MKLPTLVGAPEEGPPRSERLIVRVGSDDENGAWLCDDDSPWCSLKKNRTVNSGSRSAAGPA
ncbi:MAG: hypothetical protein QGI11_16920, partial [Nitrospinota bacterium]|nr:hypothetical protein [Nitrospinota bacterium]